eukprot:3101346-Prymnesium_polylepis.1
MGRAWRGGAVAVDVGHTRGVHRAPDEFHEELAVQPEDEQPLVHVNVTVPVDVGRAKSTCEAGANVASG